MKKIFIVLFLLLSTPVLSEEDKSLSIDDFIGNYTSNGKDITFSISKQDNEIHIYDIDNKYIFTCNIDKETKENIYLTCDKFNEKWDFFKHPYIVIDKIKPSYEQDGYIYMFYHLLGKENYEKYHCDADRKNGIYNSKNCTQIDNSGYKLINTREN